MRSDGFYWVNLGLCGDCWVVAQFHNGLWYSHLWINPVDDAAFANIDENRIERLVK